MAYQSFLSLQFAVTRSLERALHIQIVIYCFGSSYGGSAALG
jgi:hypothetical protein